jgi:CRP-like cAMP-binding protein
VIRHGSVAIELYSPPRGGVTIETLAPGEVLGWSWLLPPYRWHFDARALSQVRVTAFDGACLRRKCEEDPALGYELMQRFAQVMLERLQWTRLRLLDVYGRADG